MKQAAVVGGGHHGQRHRPRLRAARLVGDADRRRRRRRWTRRSTTIQGNLERQVKKGTIPPEAAGRGAGAHPRRPATLEAAAGAEHRGRGGEREPGSSSSPSSRQLDQALGPDAILATNTSSISITEIAARTRRPDQVIGMHFMNPVPVMQLVEVIRGHATSDATTTHGDGTGARAGQDAGGGERLPRVRGQPGADADDQRGDLLRHGRRGHAEAIDTVMKLGMAHPMGPLALADFIGLDVCLAILEVLHAGLGDDKYRPCPLLRRMVAAGHLGRKSGQGLLRLQRSDDVMPADSELPLDTRLSEPWTVQDIAYATSSSSSATSPRAATSASSPSTTPRWGRRWAAPGSGTTPRPRTRITDALRLARGMTYKSAVAGLNLGGGKSVIIGDNKRDATGRRCFRAHGRFVEIAGRPLHHRRGRRHQSRRHGDTSTWRPSMWPGCRAARAIRRRSPAYGVYVGDEGRGQGAVGQGQPRGQDGAVQGCGQGGAVPLRVTCTTRAPSSSSPTSTRPR